MNLFHACTRAFLLVPYIDKMLTHTISLNAVQGPIALQNMTSPTGAILGTGSNITFSIGFDQEV